MSIYTKALMLASLLAGTVGCWEEIRYEPDNLPTSPPSSPAATEKQAEPASEAVADLEKTPASAEELFGGSSEPVAEAAEEVEPSEASSGTTVATADDDLDWLDNPAEPTLAVPLATAWQLGSKWSLAVCIYGRSYGSDKYAGIWESAQQASEEVGVSLPPLPDGGDDLSEQEKLNWAIATLLSDAAPQLAEAVGREQTSRHRALCALACDTHVLLLNYSPSREEVVPAAERIRALGREAKLPTELWQPVVAAIESRAEFKELKAAVLKLHRRAAQHLKELAAN